MSARSTVSAVGHRITNQAARERTGTTVIAAGTDKPIAGISADLESPTTDTTVSRLFGPDAGLTS